VFIGALCFQTYYNWQACVAIGADRLRQNYQVFIVARAVQVILSLGGLYFFPNILTLAVAYAVSAVLARVLLGRVIRDLLARATPGEPAAAGDLLRTITPTALRLGWATVGEFFTNRFSLFAVSLAIGAAAAAEYALTLQAMMVLLTVSQIGTSLSVPRLAAARLTGDKDALRDLYAFCIVASVTLLGVGSAAFIVVGEPILRFIGSETMLPPLPILILLAVIYTVSVNAHTAMNIITTGNRVPQLRAVLVTGLATTIGVIIVALTTKDLFTFVAVQGVTQLAFNWWRWPVFAFRETGLTLGVLLQSAIAGGRRVVLGHP
jgi:O-antigen/teichoic acid export membrane protein